MAILNISIPHSARRLVPSAPHSAVHPPPSGMAASVVPSSALATPTGPGMHPSHQLLELSTALQGRYSPEGLLTALRAKLPGDKQIALDHFRDLLRREHVSTSTGATGSNIPLSGFLSDAMTAKLTSFAGLDELDAKWAVVTAISEILAIHAPDKKAAARLALALFRVIPCADVGVTRTAAKLYASLINLEGMSVLAESQSQTMLEWLEADARSDRKRLGAIIFFTEIFSHNEARAVVAHQIPRTIHSLWDSALQDHKLEIREAGKLALEVCVANMSPADAAVHRGILLNDVLSVLTTHASGAHAVHGALLTACVLAKTVGHSDTGLHHLWPCVLKVKDKDMQTSRAAMEFMTIAAEKAPEAFLSQWLQPTMTWLCEAMKRERECNAAVTAIARILPVAHYQAEAWLDSIVQVLHEGLNHIKRTSSQTEALLALIGGCASAFGPAIEKALTLCIDGMFMDGLSPALVKAAESIAANIPGLAYMVRVRLLDCISILITGTSFQDFAMPASSNRRASVVSLRESRPMGHERRRSASLLVRARARSVSPMRDLRLSIKPEDFDEPDSASQVQALFYLGTIDFGQQPLLLGFFQQQVVPMLSSADLDLRQAAMQACSHFLARDSPTEGQQLSSAVRGIVQAIMLIGVVDESAPLRVEALHALNSRRLEKYLVEHESVRMLICALNDEVLDVRLAVITLLTRTAPSTKATVLPSLRTELTGLLTVLDQTPDSHARHQILTVLVQILDAAPSLASLYAQPILKVLDAQLQRMDEERLVLVAFDLTKRMAQHAGRNLRDTATTYVQYTLDALRDQASIAKRRAAVVTLTDIVAYTACMSELSSSRDDIIDLLVAHLASESSVNERREAVRALGMLGASRPSLSPEDVTEKLIKTWALDAEAISSAASLESGLISTDPEVMRVRMPLYIADWVLSQLISIWRESTLRIHHLAIADAVVRIFRHERSRARSWHFLDSIISCFIDAINDHSLDATSVCFYVSALGKVAKVAEVRIEGHIHGILGALTRRWDEGLEPSNCIVEAIADIASALRGGFQRYLPLVLPKVCSVLQCYSCPEATALAALRLLQETASLLRDWAHLVVPALLAVAERPTGSIAMGVMNALVTLSYSARLTPHLSRVLPTLHKLYLCPHMTDAALRTMCSIARECGKDANTFVRGFEAHVGIDITSHPYYLDYIEGTGREYEPKPEEADDSTEVPQLNVSSIIAAFEPPKAVSGWADWLRNLTTSVVKTSNNHHVRASAPVSEAYAPLQRQLINYATYTDWVDLPEDARDQICKHLSQALAMQATLEVHDMVLHLVDFMSRMGFDLPIEPKLCKEAALRRNFLHRASRYAELEYADICDESVIDDLLKIEHDFQHREPDHALGLLTMTSQSTVEWAELGQWHQTLQAYDTQLANDPQSNAAIRGVSRCLHALQEWDILLSFGESKVNASDLDLKRAIAPIMASAAWSVNRFDEMQTAIQIMQDPERAWYSGVLATIENDLPAAEMHISSARDMLCQDLISMRGTRSGRAYDLLVRTQLLTELEEAGRYRLYENERPLIRERWNHRLGKLQKEIEVMQRCLKIHSLAIPPAENAKAMTKYARICRKSGRNDLAYKVLASTMVGAADPLNFSVVPEDEYPGLTLERCSLAYDFGDKDDAKEGLRGLVLRLSDRLDVLSKMTRRSRNLTEKMDEETKLLARCLHTLGDYVKQDDASSLFEAQIAYEKSTDLEPTAKGLRKLASVNLQIIDLYGASTLETPPDTIATLAVSVIDCYAQIIQKSTYFPLQDILGILTVIFKYGQHKEAVTAARRAFESLSIDCWLEVIPQLTAQLNHPSRELQLVMEKHMQRLARAHPHTMLSNLAAVAQYPSKERAEVARRLLNVMRLYDETLVQEALLVNHELRKCSMSPEELCIVGIERASKYLFGDEPRNPVGMIKMLEEMADTFKDPETVGELDFNTKYGPSIRSAIDMGKRYLTNPNEKDLGQIWKKWHAIHKQCTTSVKDSPMSFTLASACPRLDRCRNMKYSVPGTSQRHIGDDINIHRFGSTVEILSSKQRPRKLSIFGDDGREYKYLLKGREDLRLDERCVQLFTLVNHLLSRDQDSARRHLRMVKYAVIPLSHDAGLLSWFERGDTLHTIVRHHRKLNNLAMDAELKLTAQITPRLSKGSLTAMQQVEIFEIASECSKGDEIRSVLWRKSTSTSAWLERRTYYARSLAVSSMVGHLLGLGDRHPSNVLMDRVTGEIVQIDYGDAFEAAQERDSFPERVPFRCTRQLVNALPVTGVEGLFRLTAQLVMKVLRDNKESIEAVFSSFVHDPLIQHLVLNPRQLVDLDQAGEPFVDDTSRSVTPQSRMRSRRRKTASIVEGTVTDLSPRAQRVVNRVKQKLEGLEFGTPEALSVEEQVNLLILQATDPFNLSTSYGGWCPWW